MEAIDIALAVCKALGITATAGFGVVGMLTDFRDKTTQRVTRWGRVALFGAATSAVISLVIHGAEVWKSRSEAAASAAKTQAELVRSNELLTQVSRTLERVDPEQIRLGVGVLVPIRQAGFEAYKRRLDAKIDDLSKQLERSGDKLVELPESGLQLLQAGGAGKSRLILSISPGSDYWPDPAKVEEAVPSQFLNSVGLTVEFKSNRFPDPRDTLFMKFGGRVDGRALGESAGPGKAYLRYDVAGERVSLHVKQLRNLLPADPSRAFLSVVDFEDCEVTVEVDIGKGPTSISLGEFEVSFGRGLRSLRVLEWGQGDPSAQAQGKFWAKLSYRVDERSLRQKDSAAADPGKEKGPPAGLRGNR